MRVDFRHLIVLVPLLCQCAAKPRASSEVAASERPLKAMRYLAWFEGDFQTDYQPDRKIAEAKLKEWDGKVPDPSDTADYLEYLSVLDASGHGAEAEAKIKQYLSQHPQEKRAVFLLAVHYLRLHKKDFANYFFTQLEKDAGFPWKSLLYNNLGMIALHDKNREVAIGYFEKAIQAQPPTAAPLVNLGALHLQTRSYAEAQTLFTKAQAIDPQFEDAALGLGAAYEGQGKFEDAHKTYAEYIEENPGALSVLYNDSMILGNRLKRREDAAQAMLRYIQKGGKETAKAHESIQSWK